MSKHVGALGGLVGAVLLVGCGASGAAGESAIQGGDLAEGNTGHESEPPSVTVGDDVMLSCGSTPRFTASAMAGGVPGLADEAEVAAALEALAVEAGIDAPPALQRSDVADADWTVLGSSHRGREELIVGVGDWSVQGPSGDGDYVTLDRVDEGWRAGSWGDCNLAPVLAPGVSWAEIAATPAGLDPSMTSLTVGVQERECTSGRNPGPFLNEPVVVEDEDSVTVYWTSDAPKGDQNCIGNPPVRRVVELRDPLGDRALLDGSTWPPKPVAGA